jgi:hypothetical protein
MHTTIGMHVACLIAIAVLETNDLKIRLIAVVHVVVLLLAFAKLEFGVFFFKRVFQKTASLGFLWRLKNTR